MKKMFAFTKNRLLAALPVFCMVVTMCLSAALLCGRFMVAAADTGAPAMTATPTTMGGVMACAPVEDGWGQQARNIAARVPIYAIQQANGYYSNYMKLRDIAYFLDFDVVWNEAEPNAMRLYTKRHYLDAWEEPGPATVNKIATQSTMDIYVDDVKVTGVQPVMIEYNNYFKVRDIAKVMDFWCSFSASDYGSYVYLNRNYRYVDEDQVNSGVAVDLVGSGKPSGQYVSNIAYESPAWYSGEIGKLSDTPVTYSLRDAWGNYNYTQLYLGCTDEGMNAVAQLILDRDIIAQNTSGVAQLEPGNKLNPYYRYPMVEFQRKAGVTANVLHYDDLATGSLISELPHIGSNFGANLAIYPIGKLGVNGRFEVGILAMEYDATSEFAEAREITKNINTVQRILAQMNNLSCDREKVQFLAACVANKMIYYDYEPFDANALGNLKSKVSAAKDFPADTEFALMSTQGTNGTPSMSFKDIGNIWRDNRVYAGVCEEYSYVLENLCNAAGYYYMPIAFTWGSSNSRSHIYDAVWIPDEGKWFVFDASASSKADSDIRINTAASQNINNRQYSKDVGNGIFDFFWMMEQIKPGSWLSTDYKFNP